MTHSAIGGIRWAVFATFCGGFTLLCLTATTAAAAAAAAAIEKIRDVFFNLEIRFPGFQFQFIYSLPEVQ